MNRAWQTMRNRFVGVLGGGMGVSWCLAAVLAWSGCLGGGIDTAGASTDTLVVAGGRATDPSGAPVSGAIVRLYPSGFDPTSPDIWVAPADTTDAQGRFWLRIPLQGPSTLYTVVAHVSDSSLWGYSDSLIPAAVNDTIVLTPSRRLMFTISTVDTTLAEPVAGIAYLPGTDLFVVVPPSGVTVMPTVPADAPSVMIRFENGASFGLPLPPRTSGTGDIVADTVRIGGSTNLPVVVP